MSIAAYKSQGCIDFTIKETTAANGMLTSLSVSKRIAITPDQSVFVHWLTKSIKWDVIELTALVVQYKSKYIGVQLLRYKFSLIWTSSGTEVYYLVSLGFSFFCHKMTILIVPASKSCGLELVHIIVSSIK